MSNLTTDSDYELEKVLQSYRIDGSMIRGKSRALVEVWLDRLYPRMVDPNISTSGLLEVGKVLIELGDLKPKRDLLPTQTGPNFSISINIPQANGAAPIVITGHATDVEDADYSEEDSLKDPDSLNTARPSALDYLPSLESNSDLTAGCSEYGE